MSNAKRANISTDGENVVPVRPADGRYNRYNMTLPQSFSIYNDEGSVLYRGEVEQMANVLRAEIFGEEGKANAKTEEVKAEEEVVEVKGYTKKRGFFLVLSALFAAVMIAIAVVGLFEVSFAKYVSIYNKDSGTAFAMLDPVFSFIKDVAKTDIGGMPVSYGVAYPIGEGTLNVVMYYVLPIAICLYLVVALCVFITSIVKLFSHKREDGTYSKAKMGFAAIVMLICGLLVGACGMIAEGIKIGDILGYLGGTAALSVGYGLFAMVGVAVIVFICSCAAFGKGTVNKEKVEE